MVRCSSAMSNRVLVTGGAGYIGVHAVVALCQAGHDVVIIDDFSTGDRRAVTRAEQLVGHPIPVYELNAADAAGLDKVFAKHGFDAVMHFAGLKSVGES